MEINLPPFLYIQNGLHNVSRSFYVNCEHMFVAAGRLRFNTLIR